MRMMLSQPHSAADKIRDQPNITHLGVPRDAHDTRLPHVQLGLIHGSHLRWAGGQQHRLCFEAAGSSNSSGGGCRGGQEQQHAAQAAHMAQRLHNSYPSQQLHAAVTPLASRMLKVEG